MAMTDEQLVFTVGQAADRLSVTVRTLHHYDEIGLVVPSGRSTAGYRLYTEADLARLQNVVLYRRLEIPLDQIASLLESGDARKHLKRQRDAVRSRLRELQGLVAAIDRALEAQMTNYRITAEEQRELFGEDFDDSYAAEAEHRWGDLPEYQESQRRASSYTKEQWAQIKAEGDEVMEAFAAAKRSGAPATSQEAMDAAQAHRAQIERWFSAVPLAMHRGMADLFVADARYAASYDALEPGLAPYVRDAIYANADRQERTAH